MNVHFIIFRFKGCRQNGSPTAGYAVSDRRYDPGMIIWLKSQHYE